MPFYNLVSKDYKMVSEPGPSTMRFRGAVTELVPANRAGNVVTTVVPVGRIVAEGGPRGVRDRDHGVRRRLVDPEFTVVIHPRDRHGHPRAIRGEGGPSQPLPAVVVVLRQRGELLGSNRHGNK